jgi:hypothetical protein
MIELDIQFNGKGSQKGWTFKQLQRSGRIAIYEKRSESTVTYEVINIRVKKAASVKYPNGTIVEYQAREAYPNDEQFGVFGWAYSHLADADKKYWDLIFKVPESKVPPLASLPHNRGTQPV